MAKQILFTLKLTISFVVFELNFNALGLKFTWLKCSLEFELEGVKQLTNGYLGIKLE